ncbi:SIMPL domain-containing protein [Synechococcus sp. CS-1328]|uniref:SIMPL domain-containing protein n=1 Tax=Synechococcus sp. CS-1328 TaxID=2847976 RepID=UPI00223AE75D|nr:SIMPL domain-containing protein [Synechococcus sp. CS-1328]MCT0223673.1 SIMPL domain-containing protein [Synechococcus sp. CS-1328]
MTRLLQVRRFWGLALLLSSPLLGLLTVVKPAGAQVQVLCDGTLLEAQGSAERKRTTQRLGISLGLEAEAASADVALEDLQRRLAAVRTALQDLGVKDFRVSSPSTWQRSAEPKRPAGFTAQLQVSGDLAPERLQRLVREVGALPGVRLSPVRPQADPVGDAGVRRELLRLAYQDALRQGRELAEAIGLSQLRPLQVTVDGGYRPMPMLAKAADAAAPPPFDPAELPSPIDRLQLQAQFCAR